MSIRVTCDGCGKGIKAPEKYAGKTVNCPNCKGPLQIPPAEQPAAQVSPDSMSCPFCAEQIKATAVKCRFCGEFLDGRTTQGPPPAAVTSSAAEMDLLKCRPVMFRNNPVGFVMLCFLVLVGVVIGMVASVSGESGVATSGWLLTAVAALAFASWYLKVLTTSLVVTNKRTVLRKGILSKHTREVRHADVRLLEVKQNMFARLFGVGSLSVASAGHGEVEIFVDGIQDPQHVKETIDGYRT